VGCICFLRILFARFGALSDALFYLLKKDKVYLIDDQQFNDINTCILRAMKYGTENEFHEQSFYDSFSKISRLSAFGARLLPVRPNIFQTLLPTNRSIRFCHNTVTPLTLFSSPLLVKVPLERPSRLV
jgi:hypothetical protein